MNHATHRTTTRKASDLRDALRRASEQEGNALVRAWALALTGAGSTSAKSADTESAGKKLKRKKMATAT